MYTNTEDIDCEVCKGDLHLWAVVSPAQPGKATCPEHVSALECPTDAMRLLYRCCPLMAPPPPPPITPWWLCLISAVHCGSAGPDFARCVLCRCRRSAAGLGPAPAVCVENPLDSSCQ